MMDRVTGVSLTLPTADLGYHK
ncbi:protein of unknown function [Acidithiobacillus ferrivorans]|uniref:Uncharacterized protein n=1 Tax=Acidithiobacillus ferrivorans TaxID=160808 RepID=A0ABY1MKW3_9PROT|nr:protein of unknown function [Acidithiobacillus ferrivorans]